MQYEMGKERIINEEFLKFGYRNVVKWDVVEVKKNQKMCVRIISTNSKYLQGIRLAIDTGEGLLTVNDIKSKGIQLWEDTCPLEANLECTSSEGKMSVYNIFNISQGIGGVRSQTDSCGMLIEREGYKIVYRCNDAGFQTNFDKLVFEIVLF